MKTISSIDIHFLVQEFQKLVGGKLNQVYGANAKDISLEFYVSQDGKQFLTVRECKYIYLASERELSDKLAQLCVVLRQKLKNAILRKIEQCAGERIVHLVFEKEHLVHLYIELFAKGNIILCTKEGKIIAVAEQQKWKDRTITTGVLYTTPLGPANFKTITPRELKLLVERTETVLVKTVATALGIGGIYAEELCARAGIDKNARTLSEQEAERICRELRQLIASPLTPSIVHKKSEESLLVDIIPLPLKKYDDFELEPVTSLSAAYALLLSADKRKQLENKKIRKFDELIFKIEQRIEDQKEHIKEQERIAHENQKRGDLFFIHYQDIQHLIEWVKENRKKISFEELKKELFKNKRITKVTQRGEIKVDLHEQ